jgi:type I restriction enzyme R subunit
LHFTESNTVESMMVDLLSGSQPPVGRAAREVAASYLTTGRNRRGNGWHYVAPAFLPRQPQDVFVESYVHEALIHLNPAIAAQPDRADEVIHKLRAVVLAVRSDGLIKANEEITAWLRGDHSMPFGPHHEHVTVRLIDFDKTIDRHPNRV